MLAFMLIESSTKCYWCQLEHYSYHFVSAALTEISHHLDYFLCDWTKLKACCHLFLLIMHKKSSEVYYFLILAKPIILKTYEKSILCLENRASIKKYRCSFGIHHYEINVLIQKIDFR